METDRRRAARSAALFCILVLAIAAISPSIGGSPRAPGPGLVLWGVSPLLIAMGLRLAGRDWADAGWRPAFVGNVRWYLVAALAYPLASIAVTAASLAVSLTNVDAIPLAGFASTVLVALPIFLVLAIFEETGWRGFLQSKLVATGINPYLADAIVGVVWATWHFPFLAELSWVYTSESLVTFVPRLYLGAIAFSILYAELRVVTGSVWPAVLLHGVSNAFGHPLAANYLRSETAWLTSIGFDGLGMMILLGGMGVAMRTMRKRNAAGRVELQNEH